MQRGPNKPLEWTGLLKVSSFGIQSLPATQGQRYANGNAGSPAWLIVYNQAVEQMLFQVCGLILWQNL